jgi:hypothetical protein
MPDGNYDHPLFGPIRFRTASNDWKRGDHITFLSGFDVNDVTRIFIPQLENIPGSNHGKLLFHKRGHKQLLRAFNEIEARGLLHHIKTCAGTLNTRLRKPTNGGFSPLPSNHSFGIAIDLNESDPGFGASVAPVAPVFQALGFTWGKSFKDPMHFEINTFLNIDEIPSTTNTDEEPLTTTSKYVATKQHVLNRGVPPDDFLDQLVAWGRQAPDEIFEKNNFSDIYSSVKNTLGPWKNLHHRRAVMLEAMRVLAGFESSWDWNAGRDTSNPTSVTPDTIEAGAWQVSANSMNFGQELEFLVLEKVGTTDGDAFQKAMKEDHMLAMEYIARLLRRTVKHNGPVLRHEIDPWLRRDAVEEFEGLI